MIGDYKLAEIIGEGSSSIVMRATKTKGDHKGTYALKIFFSDD